MSQRTGGHSGSRSTGIRGTLNRWASPSSKEAKDLQMTSVKAGCCRIVDADDRARVMLQGTLRTVTLRPRGGVPALEAEMYDGSGAITLIWLGRRRITGVEPGRAIKVIGRIGLQERKRVMFNPRYELRA